MADEVIVLDWQKQFLEYVTHGLARIALSSGRAQILYHAPFTIKLAKGYSRCPRPPREIERNKMIKNNQVQVSGAVKNSRSQTFRAYFLEEKDVWAKSLTDMQIILQVTNGGPKDIVKVPPLQPGDPVNLTNYASFNNLRDCQDLRHFHTNGKLKLMSQDEVDEYFVKKADRLSLTKDTVKARAARKLDDLLNTSTPTANKMDAIRYSEKGPDTADVKPRVMHICAQASMSLPQANRLPVDQILERLSDLEETLTLHDVDHVIATAGHFKTVRKWALALKSDLETKALDAEIAEMEEAEDAAE